jgi:SPP1 family predicted phage head-tail adaptor
MDIKRRNTRNDIGQMNQRVQFKMPLKGRHSTTNEETRTYVTSSEVWAAIDHSTASGEREIASRKTAVSVVRFTMYFREAVRETWRILYRDQEFEILSVLEDGHRTFMQLEAQRVEPWRDDYIVSENEGFWTDGSGNYWVATQRGTMETQPTFGNLTWTSSNGSTWTVT